jgi:hypothetical protein
MGKCVRFQVRKNNRRCCPYVKSCGYNVGGAMLAVGEESFATLDVEPDGCDGEAVRWYFFMQGAGCLWLRSVCGVMDWIEERSSGRSGVRCSVSNQRW